MNVHGIIDAVMTEDSDVLIFGALCIIRRYVFGISYRSLGLICCSAKNDRDYHNVQVYTEDGLEHGASLAQGDRLLIALLAGGDYDKGVPGCGITIAHKVALHSRIGRNMLHAFLSMAPDEFSTYSQDLIQELRTMLADDPYHDLQRQHKAVARCIPSDFPRRAVIDKYIHPLTSFSAPNASIMQDASSCQPHLADLADFCRVQFGWDDDAIIERMYGGIWEGAYLRTLCKVRLTVLVGSR